MKKFSLALVTGASSGIGEEVAYLLANQGIDLIISGRNIEKLSQIAQEIQEKKVSVTVIVANLETVAGRNTLIEQIRKRTPDLIINNAGFGFYGNAITQKTSQLTSMVEVNIIGVMELTLEAARALIAANKPGVILNVSSAAAFFVYPTFAVYSASKTFVNNFSEALNVELKRHNIKVLAACPGMVETEFRKRAGGSALASEERWNVMTPTFAAEEIWRQIQSGKPVHIFNWKYRFYVFLSKLLPKKLVMNLLAGRINRRIK